MEVGKKLHQFFVPIIFLTFQEVYGSFGFGADFQF
jgi:hypothetical protein